MPETSLKSLAKLQGAARDPTDRHAKSQAMSMACANLARPFYLAVLLSLLSDPPSIPHIFLQIPLRCASMRIPSCPVSFPGTGDEEVAGLQSNGRVSAG